MDELVKVFNRKMKVRRVVTTALMTLFLLAFLLSTVAFVIMAAQRNNLMILWGVLSILFPVLCVVTFIVSQTLKEKMLKKLHEDLVTSNYSADEIMEIGDKTNINLFDVALEIRCKELGLTEVPVWCIHDGVLPTHR